MADTLMPVAGGAAGAVLARLAERQQQRAAEREARQLAAAAGADPREDVCAFLATFCRDHERLAAAVAALAPGGSSGGAAPDAAAPLEQLEGLSAELAALEAATSDAAYFLPPYELRARTAQLAELRAQLAGAKAALQPKRRFAFSKPVARTAPAAAAAAAAATGAASAAAAGGQQQQTHSHAALPPPPPSAHDQALIAAGHGSSGLRGATIVRSAAQLGGSSHVLHDLQGCTVVLLGPLAALRLQQLRDCTIYAGPVSGATFVSGASGCTLVLASRQVRIHEASACDVYLRVRSRPVIEHSSGLRFAPAPLDGLLGQQPQLAQHLTDAQLSEANELWRQVDDFGWVKASQSPNWAVLPEAVRVADVVLPQADGGAAADQGEQQQQQQQQNASG